MNLRRVSGSSESKSQLYLGDNAEILRYLLEERDLRGKIDFVYIDPPFATNNTFTISKNKANAISRSPDAKIAYSDTLTGDDYLEFLRERLVLLHDLMSDRGSLFVHIDYKIGHYVKVLLDEIFGMENFHNDIARIKCNPKNFRRKAFGNIKDMILFYSKTDDYIWNYVKVPLDQDDIDRLFRKTDENGRKYTTIPLHAPGETKNGVTGEKWKGQYPPKGRHWRTSPKKLDALDEKGLVEWSRNGVPRKIIYADEHKGKKIQDIIKFKDPQNPSYPTEKNLELLELMVENSSTPESIVLDCFCVS